jgi:hypothetical protein
MVGRAGNNRLGAARNFAGVFFTRLGGEVAMAKSRSRVDQLLDAIRRVMAEFADIPEEVMYEELMSEAEGWKMRLEEINEEKEDD